MPEGRTDCVPGGTDAVTSPIISRTRRSNWIGAAAKLLIDLAVFNLATIAGVLVRLDLRAAPWPWVYTFRYPGVVENLLFVAVSVGLQTPFALWSYSSLRDIERVAGVVLITKVLTLPVLLSVRGHVLWSGGAFVASTVLAFLFMAGVRSVARWRYERGNVLKNGKVPVEEASAGARVLIVGAGDAGDKVLREFEGHPELGRVVGLIDDDPGKRG
ncbi:MAG: nucleoside-diphosphate sugar epimerase/dehydratase, partial [Candidatus Cryosericum sp.]